MTGALYVKELRAALADLADDDYVLMPDREGGLVACEFVIVRVAHQGPATWYVVDKSDPLYPQAVPALVIGSRRRLDRDAPGS